MLYRLPESDMETTYSRSRIDFHCDDMYFCLTDFPALFGVSIKRIEQLKRLEIYVYISALVLFRHLKYNAFAEV